MKERIVIGIPTRGSMPSHTARTLVDVSIYDGMHGGRYLHHGKPCIWIIGASMIVNSRNHLVKQFLALEDSPEWLLMLDDDQIYPPHLLDGLMAAVGFVRSQGLACLTMGVPVWRLHGETVIRSTHNVFAWDEAHNGFVEHEGLPENAVVQVAAIGTGCLLVHRDALLRLQQHSSDLGMGDSECWFRHVNWPRNEGEDVYFCRLLMSAGVALYATSTLGMLEHIKQVRVDRLIEPGGVTI